VASRWDEMLVPAFRVLVGVLWNGRRVPQAECQEGAHHALVQAIVQAEHMTQLVGEDRQ
jgi:hypothetical protein